MKDFKELLQSHQEFMQLIRDHVKVYCAKNMGYNAFTEDNENFYNISISDGKIKINILDGDDNFYYECSIAEITNCAKDKELEEMYNTERSLRLQLGDVQVDLRKFYRTAEQFKELNLIHGVQGSSIDIVKYEQTVKKYNNTIKLLNTQIDEITEKISYRIL